MQIIDIYIPPIIRRFKFLQSSEFVHQLFGDYQQCMLIQRGEHFLLLDTSLGVKICVCDSLYDFSSSTEDHILFVSDIDEYFGFPLDIEHRWIKTSFAHQNMEEVCAESYKNNIINSWENKFSFKADIGQGAGLRIPQIGALHAIHSYLISNENSIQTIVLPTGTGKTETMLSTVVSKRYKTVLVVVPSDALRSQISEKFIKLGILRNLEVLNENCLNPVVFTLKNKLQNASDIKRIFNGANVVVSTIQSIGNLEEDLLRILTSYIDILIYDEAHHESAETWRRLSSFCTNKGIIQFTATPYRNDRKEVQGTIVYNFPLRKAQELGYFSKINFESICVFDTQEADLIIAEKAVEQLEKDLADGFDHILMARVNKIERADELLSIYQKYTHLNPKKIDSKEPNLSKIKKDIIEGRHKIIICVNMLGEGFDLPQLKIAALHDNHKSLPVFLQFIGRFARNTSKLGEAYVVANIDNEKVSDELEEIWNSNDWNTILTRISSEKIATKVEFQNFVKEYGSLDQNFPIQSLRPTLSTFIYDLRGQKTYWKTREIEKFLKGKIIYKSNNFSKRTFICITEIEVGFPWIENDSIINKSYNLYVFHFDTTLGLLFVSGTEDKSELKKAVSYLCAEDPALIKGEKVFRVFHDLKRIRLTNMGLYTSLYNGRSYMQYMGRSVSDSLSTSEKNNKAKANFFGNAYSNGVKVTIGCSIKGRIWSYAHDNILNYTKWCSAIGNKILDDSIQEEDFFKGFLFPTEVKHRPQLIPIAVDWNGDVFVTEELNLPFSCGRNEGILFELDLKILVQDISSNLEIAIVFDDKVIAKVVQIFQNNEIEFVQTEGEILWIKSQTIAQYFSSRNPRIWFENTSYLEGDLFYELQNKEVVFFENQFIRTFNWIGNGIDIQDESQGFGEINQNSIQYFTIEMIKDSFDIVFNDDNSGEIADIIAIKVMEEHIKVSLYHCKFSKEEVPNGQIANFYEVCGQAQKCIRKVENSDTFFKRMKEREASKKKLGFSRFIKGNYQQLNKIQSQAKLLPIMYDATIVQPGLSLSKITDDIRALLGATQTFIKDTSGMSLTLFCSE